MSRTAIAISATDNNTEPGKASVSGTPKSWKAFFDPFRSASFANPAAAKTVARTNRIISVIRSITCSLTCVFLLISAVLQKGQIHLGGGSRYTEDMRNAVQSFLRK